MARTGQKAAKPRKEEKTIQGYIDDPKYHVVSARVLSDKFSDLYDAIDRLESDDNYELIGQKGKRRWYACSKEHYEAVQKGYGDQARESTYNPEDGGTLTDEKPEKRQVD